MRRLVTREKQREYNRRYNERHPQTEEQKKAAREWRIKYWERTKERQLRYNKKWCRDNRARRNATYRKWKYANLEKIRAGKLLYKAIIRGRIIRPDTCPCGAPNPSGHHEDYSKPLMVMWLCHKCHMALHHKRHVAEMTSGKVSDGD